MKTIDVSCFVSDCGDDGSVSDCGGDESERNCSVEKLKSLVTNALEKQDQLRGAMQDLCDVYSDMSTAISDNMRLREEQV